MFLSLAWHFNSCFPADLFCLLESPCPCTSRFSLGEPSVLATHGIQRWHMGLKEPPGELDLGTCDIRHIRSACKVQRDFQGHLRWFVWNPKTSTAVGTWQGHRWFLQAPHLPFGCSGKWAGALVGLWSLPKEMSWSWSPGGFAAVAWWCFLPHWTPHFCFQTVARVPALGWAALSGGDSVGIHLPLEENFLPVFYT